MGASQSSIPAFADIKPKTIDVNLKLDDGSNVTSKNEGFEIITEDGNVIIVIVQTKNYAVKLGKVTTEQANTFMAKKGFPILENGSKFNYFRVFGQHGEYEMKDCFSLFQEVGVKSFCFAFNGKCNGFTISKTHGNITIDLAFLKSFLGITKSFDGTARADFPAPKAGKAPVVVPAAKVSSASWVTVANPNAINVAPIDTLEQLLEEEKRFEAKSQATIEAFSRMRAYLQKSAVEELSKLVEEEKRNKARDLAIKERKAQLERDLTSK